MAVKTVLMIVSGIVGACVVIAAVFAIVLIVPGTPADGVSVHFEGYVALPGHSLLNVLDYLTLKGRDLFVTSESSGVDAVDVFDPGTMKFFKRIPVAVDPDALTYDPRNKLFYVASGHSNMGTLIDPQALATVGTIPLGGKPEFVVFDPRSGLRIAIFSARSPAAPHESRGTFPHLPFAASGVEQRDTLKETTRAHL